MNYTHERLIIDALNDNTKGAGPRRVKNCPIKWAKLKLSFDKLFSAWTIGHI
jgi:hypothetical protein